MKTISGEKMELITKLAKKLNKIDRKIEELNDIANLLAKGNHNGCSMSISAAEPIEIKEDIDNENSIKKVAVNLFGSEISSTFIIEDEKYEEDNFLDVCVELDDVIGLEVSGVFLDILTNERLKVERKLDKILEKLK